MKFGEVKKEKLKAGVLVFQASALLWLLLRPTHCCSNWILITRPASILGMMDSYHAEFH